LEQAVGTNPAVVLIDGGAGSGKTTLAQKLREAWPAPAPELVSLDEFYPGWDGLAAASAKVPKLIEERRFTRWDWAVGGPGSPRILDPCVGLIVEGCGSITPASTSLATFCVWLDAPEAIRRERALARDGELFAPHWQQWAEQEAAHWQRDRPWALADLVLTLE